MFSLNGSERFRPLECWKSDSVFTLFDKNTSRPATSPVTQIVKQKPVLQIH